MLTVVPLRLFQLLNIFENGKKENSGNKGNKKTKKD